MKLSQLISGIECKMPDIDLNTDISDVCCDSRRVKPGCMFVCMTGTASDGHAFAGSAEQSGAAVIVAEHKTDSELPHIIVADTRTAMFELCAAWFDHPERDMKFIGVTGTNGKTSTVSYIKSILDRLGVAAGMIGTVSNMIGDKKLPSLATTPEPHALLELLSQMRDSGIECVVMEVSSHSLVQKRVCGITFDAAVFTNLTRDHLDYHKTMENYKAAKYEIFRNAKCAVLNLDDETGREFSSSVTCKKLTYSTIFNSADYVAKDIKIQPSGVDFLVVSTVNIARVHVATPGSFTVCNVLAAIGAVSALGYPFERLLPCISQLEGVDGRAQIISGEHPYTVMVDYAHTPDGLKNILESIHSFAKGRIITLFGCGGDRDRTKRPIMGEIASRGSDYVIVTSDNPRTEEPMSIINEILPGIKKPHSQYRVIENRREAIKYAIELARPDDVILLAGKGHETYQVLKTGRIDFDDREVALEYMKELDK